MKTNILATEIATLERKIEDTKSAVVKKTLRVRLATLKKQFSDAKDSSKTKNDILSKAKVKVEEMTKKDFNEYIKKLSKNDEYKFLGLMTKEEIIDDIKEVAKPVGWRFKGNNNRVPSKKQVTLGRKSGDVYYENRSNHSDVSRVVRLAKGGGVGSVKRGSGENSNYLMGYEPYFEKDVAIASINEKTKEVSPTHGYFPKHPMSKKAINWANKNGFTYISDGKKYANGGGVHTMPNGEVMLDSEHYAKGGNVVSIAKKVAEVNALIERANELGLKIVNENITWQSPMKYKPFKYSNGVLYEEYEELDLYKANRGKGVVWKTFKNKTLKANMQYDNPLNEVAKMYRKALKHYDTYGYANGGEMAKGGGVSSADKRVTESKYDDMMEVLPPIMFDTLDGEKLRGFAVDEPSDHKMIDGKMKEVYQGYYEVKEGGKTNYYAIGEYVYFDDKGKALRYEKGSASVSDEPSMAEIIEEIVDEKSIPESVVEQMIQEYGLDESNVKDWFDEHYEGEYNSDEDLAYGYVDMIGGLDALGKQTLESYFDYSAFGRDLAINDFHEHEGHYFRYKNGGMMAKGGGIYSSDDRWVVTFQNQDSAEFEKVTVRANNKKSAIAIAEDESGLGSDWSYYSAEKQMANGGGVGDEKNNSWKVTFFDNYDAVFFDVQVIAEDEDDAIKKAIEKNNLYVGEGGSVDAVNVVKLAKNSKYAKGGNIGEKKYVKVDNKSDAENILFYADKQDIASSYRKSEKDGSYTIIFEKKLEITNDMQPRIKEILENQKTKMAMGGNLGEPHRTNTK